MTRAALVIGVGAEPGLGASLCRRFAKEGLRVFASGRTRERLEALTRSIREGGGHADALAADAASASDVRHVFDAVERDSGAPPALVVFNVGNAFFQPFLEMDAAYFEQAWRVCCLAGFHVGQEAARRMVPAGGGTLLFTGATASRKARPPFTAFASAKHGLRALAFAMAREFGPQGLHVAHVVVDGGIAGERLLSAAPGLAERAGADGLLDPDAIAGAYWLLHTQHRSAWTLELDVRPYKESF
ncbi:MAG TPA: SDR family NAD(P)-dependent oxidoreductase [Myxococcota bacterium]|nr:SDR family NAD(P)-dependent oxidoreductase [Myxococcota bacterium]